MTDQDEFEKSIARVPKLLKNSAKHGRRKMPDYSDVLERVRAIYDEVEKLQHSIVSRSDQNVGRERWLFSAWKALEDLSIILYSLGDVSIGNMYRDRSVYGGNKLDPTSIEGIADLLDKLSKGWEKKDAKDGRRKMSEYDGARLPIRALQSELGELMDRLMARVDTNADRDDSLFRAWGGLYSLRDAIYELGFIADSVADIAELLDKLSRAWAKSESPDEGTSSMTFENEGFGEVTKRLIEKRKDALDALAKHDAESDRDSAERNGTD